jgi:hypothetical protein
VTQVTLRHRSAPGVLARQLVTEDAKTARLGQGVLLAIEQLTGAPPFSADSAVGLAYRHVHDDPGPPSARRPGLLARLDQITARLLAKDSAGRPASAAAAPHGQARRAPAIACDRLTVISAARRAAGSTGLPLLVTAQTQRLADPGIAGYRAGGRRGRRRRRGGWRLRGRA